MTRRETISPIVVDAITRGPPHFFGYYDKCPWSADGTKLLAMQSPFQDRPPTERDALAIGWVDLSTHAFVQADTTCAWNWQQGTMLQWLPTGEMIYNTRRSDGTLGSVIYDPATRHRRELPRPVYAVHPNGHEAISLDFHRLQTLRPGYGYPPGVALNDHNLVPDNIGLWRMDLRTGETRLALSIAQVRAFEEAPGSAGVANWFNHVTYNTDGSRFCFLHRYTDVTRPPGAWRTRLLTARSDGSGLFVLNGLGMTSHFAWRDPHHLLAWTCQERGGEAVVGYWEMTDESPEARRIGEGVLVKDGHMSYSPDQRWLITDEYPGPERIQPLFLFDLQRGRRIELARFAAPLTGELRCDLHARWNRTGDAVCFDSAHDGVRQIYVADVRQWVAR